MLLVVDQHHLERSLVCVDDLDRVALLEDRAVGEIAVREKVASEIQFVAIDLGEDHLAVGRKYRSKPVRRVAESRAELEDPAGVDRAREKG